MFVDQPETRELHERRALAVRWSVFHEQESRVFFLIFPVPWYSFLAHLLYMQGAPASVDGVALLSRCHARQDVARAHHDDRSG